MAKKLALIFGVLFVVIGLLSFIPNIIIGHDGYFHTNEIHAIVHLLVGIILVGVALAKTGWSAWTLKIIGIVYLLLAAIGLFVIDETGLGSILGLHVNIADNWLHLVLGLILIGTAIKFCHCKACEVISGGSNESMGKPSQSSSGMSPMSGGGM